MTIWTGFKKLLASLFPFKERQYSTITNGIAIRKALPKDHWANLR